MPWFDPIDCRNLHTLALSREDDIDMDGATDGLVDRLFSYVRTAREGGVPRILLRTGPSSYLEQAVALSVQRCRSRCNLI